MPEENQQERTEIATPRRREEARKKGQVAKSIEINTAVILFITFIFIYFYGNYFVNKSLYYAKVVFENMGTVSINADNILGYTMLIFQKVLILLGPIIAVMLGIGLLVNFAQVGVYFTLEPISPKWNKVDPLAGFKRIFVSKRSLVELLKGILKIIIIGYIGYSSVKGVVENYIILMDKDVYNIFSFIAHSTFIIGIKIAIALLILAGFDYLFQWHDYEQSIKMTKFEVREELKQMEGDPLIKARIRSIQRDMARRRMMREVQKADVVITNPTFLAIALKYDVKIMSAPTVVAKGERLIAEKIREIAIENEIPIVENKPLAQALYKSCDVGDEIPEQFFYAVAEVLAYIYRLKRKTIGS